MSDQDYQNQFYNPQGQEAGYDMSSMPMDQQFGQFDYSQAASYEAPFIPEPAVQPQQSNPYAGSILTPAAETFNTFTPAPTGDSFEEEPPLMEELGINFDHIMQKTLAVLNPLREPDTSSLQDTDMAGPLVFCLAFGGCLLLVGKLQFGYIYGIGVVGCLAMYTLLNLMSMTGVAVSCIVSVLGYCLLPMVLLSSLAVLISLKGVLGVVMTTFAVLWCSVSASKLFVTALAMDQQQLLVAYPCALVYGVFALLTVF